MFRCEYSIFPVVKIITDRSNMLLTTGIGLALDPNNPTMTGLEAMVLREHNDGYDIQNRSTALQLTAVVHHLELAVTT